MRRVLVLEDRPDHTEVVQSWIDRNYPGEGDSEIVWMDDVSGLTGREIAKFDVIIFTGTVGGIELHERFNVLNKWKYKVFVFSDNEISTRKFLVQLKKLGIQTFRMI